MTERQVKRLLVLLSVAWMAFAGWFLLQPHMTPEVEALRQQQFEQKMNECRGRFAERYECTSSLLRQQSSDKANWWAMRLFLVFGPPLAASAAYAIWWNVRERRREAARNRAREERLEHETHENHPADQPPLREIDEIRRRADERRRTANQPDDPPDPTTPEPTKKPPAL